MKFSGENSQEKCQRSGGEVKAFLFLFSCYSLSSSSDGGSNRPLYSSDVGSYLFVHPVLP